MKAAAFYDVDGTLISTNVVHIYGWYALNVPGLADRLTRGARLAAALPFYAVADRIGRKFFNDIFYRNYRGIPQDRLYVLGEELFDRVVKKKVFQDMIELMKRSRAEGYAQVLVTGALDTITAPLARYLEVDHWFANKLEFIDGEATGELVAPVLAGPQKAETLRRFALEHGYDLNHCRAYADSASDIPMLSAVGRPVAVNPDTTLKATAHAHDWPVMWAK